MTEADLPLVFDFLAVPDPDRPPPQISASVLNADFAMLGEEAFDRLGPRPLLGDDLEVHARCEAVPGRGEALVEGERHDRGALDVVNGAGQRGLRNGDGRTGAVDLA